MLSGRADSGESRMREICMSGSTRERGAAVIDAIVFHSVLSSLLYRQWILGGGQARATSISRSGSVRSKQQRLWPKDMPPCGLPPIWPVASLLGRSSIAADTLLPSRLATGQIGGNERMRIYEIDH